MGSGICICIPPPQIILLWVVQELPCADHCVRRALIKELIEEGEKVVITAGIPLDIPGNTNMIRVEIA